jgi:hypothetical protein
MTDRPIDTPTDRRATFALLASLREAAGSDETRRELEQIEQLARGVLEEATSTETLLAEELGVADRV